MKLKKTFKETRKAMWKTGWADTPFQGNDGKYYKQNYIYGWITSIFHFIFIFVYVYVFIFIVSFCSEKNFTTVGLFIGFISIGIIEYIIEFLFTFLAPLTEVEAPKEGGETIKWKQHQ